MRISFSSGTRTPKHEGKKKAHDRWTRMTLQDRLAAFAGLRKWKDSGRWGDVQFVPQATTYLNGRRWEDEIAKFGGGDGQFVNKRDQAQRATLEAARRTMERHSDEISGPVLSLHFQANLTEIDYEIYLQGDFRTSTNRSALRDSYLNKAMKSSEFMPKLATIRANLPYELTAAEPLGPTTGEPHCRIVRDWYRTV